MAAEFCAVEGCTEYPATKRLQMEFRTVIERAEGETEPADRGLLIIFPVCEEHHRQLEEWQRQNTLEVA